MQLISANFLKNKCDFFLVFTAAKNLP